MDNLQIITNSITPAKVDFNYKEIEKQLDIVLDKYKGLVFTEETVADCKRTMAELRKGQKSLDTFRKETKKKLTKSVAEFENDCKSLYSKFDNVIDPLKEQADYFEVTRREDKRIEVQGLIDNTIEEFELDSKRAKELVIIDKYLLSSTTIKKITTELETQAGELKEVQDQEELDLEFISATVKETNIENDLNLLDDNYLRLMEVMDVSRIIPKIYQDANKLVKAREDEKIRLAKVEADKIAREEKLENERLAKEAADKLIEEIEEIETTAVQEQETTTEDELIFNSIDFEDLPARYEGITKIYKVTGNAEQINDLEMFLNGVMKEWEEVQ